MLITAYIHFHKQKPFPVRVVDSMPEHAILQIHQSYETVANNEFAYCALFPLQNQKLYAPSPCIHEKHHWLNFLFLHKEEVNNDTYDKFKNGAHSVLSLDNEAHHHLLLNPGPIVHDVHADDPDLVAKTNLVCCDAADLAYYMAYVDPVKHRSFRKFQLQKEPLIGSAMRVAARIFSDIFMGDIQIALDLNKSRSDFIDQDFIGMEPPLTPSLMVYPCPILLLSELSIMLRVIMRYGREQIPSKS